MRFHSAEYFIEEVKYILKSYRHAKRLYIMDDLFIANKKRFEEIYSLWMSGDLHKRISPNGFIRSNCLDKDIALKMKEMVFRSVRFGAESGSDRMLKFINKQATVSDHQKAIDICNSIGLPVGCSFMYDLPQETEEDKLLTKKFIKKNKGKIEVQGYYKFKSFPGTDFYDGTNPVENDMRVR